jgi:hypothetical protein
MVCGNLVHFSRFCILYQEKSGSPGFPARKKNSNNFEINQHLRSTEGCCK